MTSTFTYTSDFREEFAAAQEHLLRRRFLWYTWTVAGLNGLMLALLLLWLWVANASNKPIRPAERIDAVAEMILGGLTIGAYLLANSYVRGRTLRRERLLEVVWWLFVGTGASMLFGQAATSWIVSEWTRDVARVTPTEGVLAILLTHFFACLFLPWKPVEAFKPLVPLLLLNAALTIPALRAHPGGSAAALALSPLIWVPGGLVCWWKTSRFRERFAVAALKGRYSEIRRDLIDARRIHESLFPKPVLEGPLTFRYVYEPMRQIGGDYLYARFTPPAEGNAPAFNMLVFDVTGHGIAAALTVNRLYGEVERLFAEDPHTRPRDVLAALNRYVHGTLAGHSVYVTALCVRVDQEDGKVEYASGGHPPAFIRGVDGTIEQLDSTAIVLGACAGADFEVESRSHRFGPGDCLIAYTDGALEARNEKGRMLGIAGLQRILAGVKGGSSGMSESVLEAVRQHRHGPPADDTLIVEVSQAIPQVVTAAATARTRASAV